ncbi:tetratricopeptide repeat protein [Chitinophaga cymbidii]|nr:tetratricopeptide repeat protein [Chitinophaga cymbidii]
MNDIDYELIERYLSGDMSAEARAAFETRMLVEPALKDAVQHYAEVQDSLRQSLKDDPQREQLKQTLESNRHVFREAKRIPLRRYYITAASIAAVIAVVLFWSPWQQDVYQQFGVQEMVSPAERGNASDSLLQSASAHFNHHRYEQAIDDLNKVIEHHPEDAFAIYYRGLAYLENKQSDYARADLEMIYNGESVFKYEAAFYIALSYFREDKKDQCRNWLEKIPAEAGDTHERAQRLAKEL